MRWITRADVAAQIDALVRGVASLDQLRDWFAQLLIDADTEATERDGVLVSRLMFLFESDDVDETEKLAFANRILPCLRSDFDNETLVELVPVLFTRDRLCAVIDKYRSGAVSRTGFVSFISNAHFPERVKTWLLNTNPAGLQYFCDSLASGDYLEVAHMME